MAFLPAPSVFCGHQHTSSVSSVCRTARRGATPSVRAPRASADPSSMAGGGGSVGGKSLSEGATLPEVHPLVLDAQSTWLELTLRSWLDNEFRTSDAHIAHRAIAKQTSLLYRRLRAEGIHDLTTVVLELGGGLEGSDNFREAFVGPWNIANKAGELLIQNTESTAPRGENEASQAEMDPVAREEEGVGLSAVPPGLNDAFDQYRFLQLVLDGEVSSARVNGAVAQVVGYAFDETQGKWSAAKVTDEHFSTLGDTPPDVLGDESAVEWTKTLRYMEKMLRLQEDEGGQKAEGFQTLLETLNGFEMTKKRQADEADHAFAKRSAVVKWLHVIGDYC